ncbi:MAG: c-type cytochrome [Acidimicrobiia bacterium]|nr:c-type cytochrome [Acidimicrobiia bacterium]
MKAAVVFLALACAAAAADADIGATVFRQSCAVGYCHGSGGAAGRAPKMLGRVFDYMYVHKVTSDGIPNTGMPGWKDRLSVVELNAVVAYVVRISGGVVQEGVNTGVLAGKQLPQQLRQSKELFFDAVRAVRCSTCHSLEGIGTPVGPNLASAYDVKLIREGKPATVRKAAIGGDSFPALLVETKDAWTTLYDLSVAPPVLRTVARGDVTWSGGSGWSHAKAIAHYKDGELAKIAAYLAWLSTN